MTNNITIKSGIDIDSAEFKAYYEGLKKCEIKSPLLDFAISDNSEVLNNPMVFEEKDYDDYKVDDISFIINDEGIIGHMIYSLQKIRPTIPLSIGEGNHMDLERVSQIPGRICFNKLEYFCKYNININNLIVEYLSARIRGKLDYKGNVSIENKIHIKK